MRYKDKTLLMIDHGLFIELAIVLAQNYGTVYYYAPWEESFPRTNVRLMGWGIPEVTRIYNIWEVYDEVDIFVFPDVYFGEFQEWLVSQGKRVWGSRTGEFLELDRAASKEACRAAGIDIGPYEVIQGISALRKHLIKNEDQYVKVSCTRGDMETFHSPNYDIIEPKIDELEWMLGGKKELMQFIVEEAINDAIETGYDGFTIDGQFANQAMFGIEIKNKCYVLECREYDKLPLAVREVNAKLSSIFREHQYRGFFSSEIRVKRDKAYLIDPCCRAGIPPNEIMQVMVSNWDQILWEGSEGRVVEPRCLSKFGAEILLHSSWADKNWQPVQFPDSMRKFVKLYNLAIIDDKYYTVPQNTGVAYIGGVVGVSDDLEDAIAKARRVESHVEAYYLESFPESLDEARAEYEKLEELE